MTPKYSLLQGMIFFAIAFLAVLAIEAILLAALSAMFNSRLMPRGIGWIVLPILGGVAGWQFGRQAGIESFVNRLGIEKLNASNRNFRVWVAGSAL